MARPALGHWASLVSLLQEVLGSVLNKQEQALFNANTSSQSKATKSQQLFQKPSENFIRTGEAARRIVPVHAQLWQQVNGSPGETWGAKAVAHTGNIHGGHSSTSPTFLPTAAKASVQECPWWALGLEQARGSGNIWKSPFLFCAKKFPCVGPSETEPKEGHVLPALSSGPSPGKSTETFPVQLSGLWVNTLCRRVWITSLQKQQSPLLSITFKIHKYTSKSNGYPHFLSRERSEIQESLITYRCHHFWLTDFY